MMKTETSAPPAVILRNMQQVLSSLLLMMQKEQQELVSAHPDSYQLQSLTEDKQAALNTLTYLEGRLKESEKRGGVSAPYHGHDDLSMLWTTLCGQISQLQQTNQHTGLLLQQQLHWTEQALALLTPLRNQHFYGPDGQAK